MQAPVFLFLLLIDTTDGSKKYQADKFYVSLEDSL